MSVCNLIVQPDAAYLVTDSGYFDSEGRLLVLMPKSIILPNVPVALGAVGSSGLVLAEAFLAVPERFGAGGFTLDRFRDLIREIYQTRGYDQRAQFTRWVAAYYSTHHRRACGYVFSTNPDDGGPEEAAWKWHPVRTMVQPYVQPVEVWGTETKVAVTDPKQFLPQRDSMKFVHAQRQHLAWPNGNYCGVAGEIRLTKVSRKGVQEWKLHDYPDEVGSFIRPSVRLSD